MTSAPTRVLLTAHGSRDPRFANTAQRIRARVADRMPAADVTLAYLDLNEPLVADALAACPTQAIVVPLLLAPGYHSETDLPGIVAEHARGQVQTAPVTGTTSLVAALADRLGEAGLCGDDGIILTAVGSTNPLADTLIRRRAVELSTALHRPVEVVYATKLGPQDRAVAAAVRRLRAAGATRVAVSPYFLSAGLLTERVEKAVDRLAPGAIVAGPLGAHPQVIDAVVAQSAQSLSAATLVARA